MHYTETLHIMQQKLKRHNGYKKLDYLIYEFSIQNCLRTKKIILGSFIKMSQNSLWAKKDKPKSVLSLKAT